MVPARAVRERQRRGGVAYRNRNVFVSIATNCPITISRKRTWNLTQHKATAQRTSARVWARRATRCALLVLVVVLPVRCIYPATPIIRKRLVLVLSSESSVAWMIVLPFGMVVP